MVGSSYAGGAGAGSSALRRLVAGVLMLLVATALSAHGLVAVSASAQEVGDEGGLDDGDDDGDAGGFGGGTTEEVEITEIALYAHSIADVVPGTLRTGVPPAVVCVLATQLCPEQTDDLRNLLSGALNTLLDSVPPEPFHPVPPDTLAVSVLGGNDRYASAVRFEMPPLPEGEEFTSFELRLPAAQPSFDVNSPAFRRAVLGLFETIADADNDPTLFFDGLQEALVDESLLDINENILGIEACPFTAPFEPGGPPAAQNAEEDLPRDEEFGDVEVDCLLGTSGQLDEDAGEWVFELSFAANAWGQGELENLGLLLQPSGVQNLAFGDPDTSTSGQIALGTEHVTATFDTAEPPPPPGDLGDFDDGFGDDDFGDDGFEDDGFADAPGFDDGGFDDGDGFLPGPAVGGPTDADAPAVADDLADAPQAADEQAGEQQVLTTRPARGEPVDPWWLWLLVPLFGGGGYLVAAPLLAPTATAGTATPGAMSRLIARSGGGLAT